MKQHSRSANPVQVWEPNTRSGPIAHERTTRRDSIAAVTSGWGGKLVPLAMVPLLREDSVLSSTLRINVQMAETADMLLNPVRISAAAYFVPKLAFERFLDMGTIDRSYNGVPERDGAVVPWFEKPSTAPNNTIFNVLGLHLRNGAAFNSDYIEAYNAVWNYIAANRSPSIALRDKWDGTLGPAFWRHTQMKHVVPTFDDAMLEGVVPVTVLEPNLPVKGIGTRPTATFKAPAAIHETGGIVNTDGHRWTGEYSSDTSNIPVVMEDTENAGFPAVFAELQNDGFEISLANIDQARETAAWARMRTQFQGKSDEWMIDQLLQGIRLNDDALKQPILLDSRDTLVGMSQRYATDSGNLSKSVVDGRTALELRMRVPQTQCGGVVVVVAQALPEQIFERQRDHYLVAMDVSALPNRTADELDPQPVSMVRNAEVDESHTMPDDLFGYAPLNHEWVRQAPRLGGKYFKADPTAPWDENRNRIWDSGVIDPALGPDFYMSTQLQHEVFETSTVPPFEFWTNGDVRIGGLTYFGPALREALDDYEKVIAQVSSERLEGDGTDVPAPENGGE